MGEFDRLSTPENGASIARCNSTTINEHRRLVALVLPPGYLTRCPLKKAQP
jgi:hypothetical protein